MLSASGLSNKFGLKRIWMLAMALFTASSLLCAFAGNISLLLVGRSIQGAAGAFIIPGAMSIIFHAFDDAKLRAKVVRRLVHIQRHRPDRRPVAGRFSGGPYRLAEYFSDQHPPGHHGSCSWRLGDERNSR